MTLPGALQLLDIVVAAAVEEEPRNDPPASAGAGNIYIVGALPTGAWTGNSSALAALTQGGWRFIKPVDGLQAWVKSTSTWAVFRAGAWEVGAVRAGRLMIGGVQVVGEQAQSIAEVTGGAIVDAEARSAIGSILDALRAHGLVATE